MPVFDKHPTKAAHASIRQLVSFQAPITGTFSAPADSEIGNVTIFTAGTSSRPSRIVPIAISAESPDWVAFPLTSSEDFVDLCQRLGFEDDMARNELNKFLTPRSKRHG